jgi:hypothetical protein
MLNSADDLLNLDFNTLSFQFSCAKNTNQGNKQTKYI